MRQLKILVAPLDWGLGHATRCIPIIQELEKRGMIVEVASSGKASELLIQEFPKLTHHAIPGYGITYPKNGKQFMLMMIRQIPRIFLSVQKEHKWLKKKQKKHRWDMIISDNRYGLWHPSIQSIFMTHQLRIRSGWGNPFDSIIQRFHYKLIERFDHCWIPDDAGEPNLGGVLSHPRKIPCNATYIGPLSRLSASPSLKNRIVVSLSGPEPQRSILEAKMMQIFSHQKWDQHEILLLRGIPGEAKEPPFMKNNWQLLNHLNSSAFSNAIAGASLVICRSGYSSIMDLIKLQKKAVLIPTPGQTKQEYLADWLQAKNLFHSCSQDDPLIETVIEKALEMPNPNFAMDFEGYKKALDDLDIQ